MTEVLPEPSGTDAPTPDPRQLAVFEDRYGLGAHARLIRRLQHPCVTFAQIADEFGVTRERVRQWQLQWLPGAPRGLERRRQCRIYRRRQRLLEEPLFQSFYRQIRPQLAPGRLRLIPTRDGFRRRVVRLDGHVVFLKAARPVRQSNRPDVPAYALTASRGDADFLYFGLGDADYLFMPASALPRTGTTFLDSVSSKYQRFRNTLAALEVGS